MDKINIGKELQDLTFKNMDLSNYKFIRCNMKNTKFIKCNLNKTIFHMSDLSNLIIIKCKNIETTSFKRCNLERAEIEKISMLEYNSICPSHGSFIGWKATKDAIVKLEILKDALRLNPIGSRHCRANKVRVIEIFDKNKNNINSTYGLYFNTKYEVGKMVYADKFNDDSKEWCEHGIGFFITRNEAEQFLL